MIHGIYCFRSMSSPAKVDEKQNGKSEEKPINGKKSPAHSVNGVKRAPSRAESQAAETEHPEPFGWFRIFKLAGLMIKQGC